MGFRKGAYAKCWEINPVSDTSTKVRLSTSFKNKQTDEYEQDFSGFVMFVGTACAAKAAKLQKGDRIRLGDVDVTTKYVKEKETTYTNFKAFGFDNPDELDNDDGGKSSSASPDEKAVDDGEAEEPKGKGKKKLPF